MYNIFWFRDYIEIDKLSHKYLPKYNFGDEIVPWLFKKMFNWNLDKPCHRLSSNMLFSIGSILWACNESTTVWGSGIISRQEKIIKPKNIYSVRGLFSRQRLLDLGYDCPISFGDPAILCPNYFYPVVNKNFKLGIIPHAVEYETVSKYFINIPNIKVINLNTNNIESVIEDVVSCDQTISSALHGLIISVIYNIPTKWVIFSNKLHGDGIKFYDFFSSLDKKVFDNFDHNLFKTENNIYNPLVIDSNYMIDTIKNLDINTIFYPIETLSSEKIYESCPISK